MFENCFVCFAGVRRRTSVSAVMVMTLLTGLGVVSSALAKEPTGDFAVFKQCPRYTPGVVLCHYSQITGGEMTLNGLTVPIVNPVLFQGGIERNEETEAETFVAALDGETLSPTPQPVPGGMASLIDCDTIKGERFMGRLRRRVCREVFRKSWFSTVNATTELARPASEISINRNNEVNEEGVSLVLPVRVHLENPLLGRSCYIGSSADPIVFSFTTGTTSPPPPNKPINGTLGELAFKDEFAFVEVTKHVQVDNAFSAPEATGCGGPFSFLIDRLINDKIGLPSPAGYNTIIHSGYGDEALAKNVIKSETGEEENRPGEKDQDDQPQRKTR